MNIKRILLKETRTELKQFAATIVELAEYNKLMISCSFRDDLPITQGYTLIELYHALHKNHPVTYVTKDGVDVRDNNNLRHFISLVNDMAKLLFNHTFLCNFKFVDYMGDMEPKFARAALPYLDGEYAKGNITIEDVEQVFKLLEQPLPQSFK